jgi:hypothetical protein
MSKLIEYGAELNLTDNRKHTALDLAIYSLGSSNATVQKMIVLGAKCFCDLKKPTKIISKSLQPHPKIDFAS